MKIFFSKITHYMVVNWQSFVAVFWDSNVQVYKSLRFIYAQLSSVRGMAQHKENHNCKIFLNTKWFNNENYTTVSLTGNSH